jgi:hypothetical protein
MKIFLIFLIFASTLVSNELQWVDKQISSILPNRDGINIQELSNLKDPFITVVEKETPKRKTNFKVTKKRYKTKKTIFKLGAIMNNSALINTHWYKVGSTVKGYKISSIQNSVVILKRGKRTLHLTTKTKKSTLKILK